MAQPSEANVHAVCSHWLGAPPEAVLVHGAAGLSGAPVYVVVHAGRRYALKRFVATTTHVHAQWVHGLMQHVRTVGLVEVPEVMRGRTGVSVQADAVGGLWELIEWKTGAAVDTPSREQVAAAATLLAHVHRAAATLPGHAPHPGFSPGMQRRIAQAGNLLERPWAARDGAASPAMPSMTARLHQAASIVAAVAGRRGIARVAGFEPYPVVLQPVLRDVWSDHVLFAGGHVTGIIDWHAAGVDTPATDIARLLGSWSHVGGAEQAFLSAYSKLRPLDDRERGLIAWLQASGVVCALDNWFRWTVEEHRTFADMQKVEGRVDRLLESLPTALARLARTDSPVLG